MGLDVSSSLVVGVREEEILFERTITRDIVKTDKNGVNYIIEEQEKVIEFLGKTYPANSSIYDDNFDLYAVLDEMGLEKFSDEIIGVAILDTPSHRTECIRGPIKPEYITRDINHQLDRLESLGIKGSVYLVTNVSW